MLTAPILNRQNPQINSDIETIFIFGWLTFIVRSFVKNAILFPRGSKRTAERRSRMKGFSEVIELHVV